MFWLLEDFTHSMKICRFPCFVSGTVLGYLRYKLHSVHALAGYNLQGNKHMRIGSQWNEC